MRIRQRGVTSWREGEAISARLKRIDRLWHRGADSLCWFEVEPFDFEIRAKVIRELRLITPRVLLLAWGPGAWELSDRINGQFAKLRRCMRAIAFRLSRLMWHGK
jgi:hypothetical protein